MQKTINKIQELTIHQHKSIIIFIIADDCFFLDVNTKNFPTPSNVVEIKDEEFEKFLNKVG